VDSPDYNNGHISSCVVFTTYNTFSSKLFVKITSRLNRKSLLLCDEVHWAGANTFRQGLLPNYSYRLGLSATPARYFDEEGTDYILAYFNRIVYEFSLERALSEENPATGKAFLCPYDYYPHFVALMDNERVEYAELSAQISRVAAIKKESDDNDSRLQRLLEKRQAIITNAQNKYACLETLLSSLRTIRYLLVYCSPAQIDRSQSILNCLGIINHRFTGREGTSARKELNGLSERENILRLFEQAQYMALVAMKCLDEGINVTRAEHAILMASSGNPKEYVQRRGRLLRTHPEKERAKIYDIIVLPHLSKQAGYTITDYDRLILSKEFTRYEEFASLARNKVEALNMIYSVKKLFNFREV
jgi:superfamily II DNA or RNA helicase